MSRWRRNRWVFGVGAAATAISGTLVVPIASAHAAAPPPAFQAVTPARLLDTRAGQSTVDGLFSGTGALGPGGTLVLQVAGRGGLPASGVATVAVNVTAVNATQHTFVTVFPTGRSLPTASNLNPVPGAITTNTTHVGVASDGTISLYNLAGSVDLIVDLHAWFPTGPAGCLTAGAPARLLDTRPEGPTTDGLQSGVGAIGPASTLDVQVTGRAGVPAGSPAAIVNITVATTTEPTFISAYPTDALRPEASTLNPSPGRTISNATHVRLGASGAITLFNLAGSAHVIVDLLGWYAPGSTCFVALEPARLVDTRPGVRTIDGLHAGEGALGTDATLVVRVAGRGGVPASGVAAVAVNVTAVSPTTHTFLTIFPSDRGRPVASNLNPAPGAPVSNGASVPVAPDGTIALYNPLGATHLIVDVLGWFPATGGGGEPAAQHPRIYLPGAKTRLSAMLNGGAPTATRFRSYADARLSTSFQSLWDSSFPMWYFALLGNLTDDPRYCARAVAGVDWWVSAEEARIASYNPSSPASRPRVAYDSYLEVGPIVGDVMTVYDWCHASVTSSQRLRWASYADQAIWNVWNPEQATWGGRPAPWSGWSIDNPSNNYYYSFLRATMLFGLAAEGEFATAAGWKTFFRTTKIQNQLLPTFNRDLVGGGSREGTGYGTALMRLWEIYDLWEMSTGEDIGALTPHTRASLVQFLHYIVPTRDAVSLNGDHSRDSTGALFDYHRHYGQSLAHVVGDGALAGRVRALLDTSSVPRMQNGFMIVYDFLYDLTSTPTQPLSALNTAYFAPGAGQLYARSSWDTVATWLNVTAGPYTESHAHRDQGSFLLHKSGWMATDPNFFSHSGIRQEETFHNLVRIVDGGGATVPQREGASSTVQALRQGNGWVHLAADTTAVYTAASGAPVQRVQREVVYLQPDVVVVFDRVTTSPGTQQVWQLNSPVSPVVAGGEATFTSNGTTMTSRRIFPAAAPTSVYDWRNDGEVTGGFRLDETLIGGAQTYLHVVSFGSAVSSAARSDLAGRQGVAIDLADGRDAVVRFSPTGVDGTLTITDSSGATVVSAALTPSIATLPELSAA